MILYEYHPDAATDLEEAVDFYELRSSGLGSDLADEVDWGIAQIRRHPESGEALSATLRRKVLQRFPYTLIYSLEPGLIFVVAVAHHKRRPGYWRKRLR